MGYGICVAAAYVLPDPSPLSELRIAVKCISFLIKPASSLCNMRCRYCFYADVAEHRQVKSHGVMRADTMRALVDRALALAPDANITFAFQGGEPTVAGLDFFRSFTDYVDAHRDRQRIHYGLQTNAYLIDDEWAAFFAKHRFLIGVSLDGYREMHDWLRPDARGAGTYGRVMSAIGSLRNTGVDFNVLTVLTAPLAKHPQRLYRFYRKQNLDFVQLIPCLPGLDEGDGDEFSLTPRLFASFYQAFFKLWADDLRCGRYMSVTLFDNVTPMFAGYAPQQCGMLGACAPQFVIESSGDVYPCDFYVLDRYRMGNISHDSLEDLAVSDALRSFLAEERRPCAACNDCPFERMCHRNCKRLNVAYYDEDYCGYRAFLEFATPEMIQIARSL